MAKDTYFDFEKLADVTDDRALLANMVCRLIYQKHAGDYEKMLPELRILDKLLTELVRNIYELIDNEVPLLAYLNLVEHGKDNYHFTDEEYQNAIADTIKACVLYYSKYPNFNQYSHKIKNNKNEKSDFN